MINLQSIITNNLQSKYDTTKERLVEMSMNDMLSNKKCLINLYVLERGRLNNDTVDYLTKFYNKKISRNVINKIPIMYSNSVFRPFYVDVYMNMFFKAYDSFQFNAKYQINDTQCYSDQESLFFNSVVLNEINTDNFIENKSSLIEQVLKDNREHMSKSCGKILRLIYNIDYYEKIRYIKRKMELKPIETNILSTPKLTKFIRTGKRKGGVRMVKDYNKIYELIKIAEDEQEELNRKKKNPSRFITTRKLIAPKLLNKVKVKELLGRMKKSINKSLLENKPKIRLSSFIFHTKEIKTIPSFADCQLPYTSRNHTDSNLNTIRYYNTISTDYIETSNSYRKTYKSNNIIKKNYQSNTKYKLKCRSIIKCIQSNI